MIRISIPSLFSALWMGTFWRNAGIVLVCGGLLLFFLSPWLMMMGLQMPWMPPDYINFWWLFFGMFGLVALGAWAPTFAVQGWNDFLVAMAISRARRVFYGLKQDPSGKIGAELCAFSHDGQKQIFDFQNNLAHAMPKEIYRQAREMFTQRRDLPPGERYRVTHFGKQARKIIDLLERQNRDVLLLETDEAMIDKMEWDYLFLVSRLSQMKAAVSLKEELEADLKRLSSTPAPSAHTAIRAKEEERMTILTARLAQMEHRDRLRDEVTQEVLSLEERLAFIHDALSLHGHPQVIKERLYLPSPLMAELKALSWENL
jgi:hypothetical protein